MNNSKLTTSVGDYRDVEIPPDSVIYCDIPYFSTRTYRYSERLCNSFDYDAFYDWCEKQEQLVLISEFWMPEDRFICIAERPRRVTFGLDNSKIKIEKVFVPVHQYEMYKRLMKKENKK